MEVWFSISGVFALTAAIILIFILNVLPARMGDRNQYLLVFLYGLALHLLAGLLMVNAILDLSVYALISLMVVVGYGPTFYYYLRKIHGLGVQHYLLHLIPLEMGLLGMFFLQYQGVLEVPKWCYHLYYTTAFVTYFVAILKMGHPPGSKSATGWRKTIARGFGGLMVLYILESIWMVVDFASVNEIVLVNATLYNMYCFVFILIAIKQIMTRPEVFSHMRIRIPYTRERIKGTTSELDWITSYVVAQKAFKNPDLTREVVRRETGVTVHRISEIINAEFAKNFNEWLNDHRIHEAKILLRESQMSIKEIYFEVGFNTKSSFNGAFKKRTGETPSAFRNTL